MLKILNLTLGPKMDLSDTIWPLTLIELTRIWSDGLESLPIATIICWKLPTCFSRSGKSRDLHFEGKMEEQEVEEINEVWNWLKFYLLIFKEKYVCIISRPC